MVEGMGPPLLLAVRCCRSVEVRVKEGRGGCMHVQAGGAGLGRFIMQEVRKKLQEGLRSGGRFFGLVVGDKFPCDRRNLPAPVSAFIELLDGLVDSLSGIDGELVHCFPSRVGVD